jgi:histidine ammonia-lyase
MLDTGINSAFMMPQYTSAALASENKTLCFPASADSIPTSLGQEDHVSMGSISGRKALQVIGNVEKILAIEMMYAAQAFDYHLPLKSGELINKVHAMVREHIDHAEEDRVFADDMEKALKLLRSAEILKLATNSGLINSEYDKEFEIY